MEKKPINGFFFLFFLVLLSSSVFSLGWVRPVYNITVNITGGGLDTNASTACSDGEYLDGNGFCIPFNYTVQDLSLNESEANLLYITLDEINNTIFILSLNVSEANELYVAIGTKLGNTSEEIWNVVNNGSFAYIFNVVDNITYHEQNFKHGNTTDEIWLVVNNGTFQYNITAQNCSPTEKFISYADGSFGCIDDLIGGNTTQEIWNVIDNGTFQYNLTNQACSIDEVFINYSDGTFGCREFSGSGTIVWNSSGNNVYVMNKEIGIGTPNPTKELHILGNSPTFLLESNTTSATYFEFKNTNTFGYWRTYINGDQLALFNPVIEGFVWEVIPSNSYPYFVTHHYFDINISGNTTSKMFCDWDGNCGEVTDFLTGGGGGGVDIDQNVNTTGNVIFNSANITSYFGVGGAGGFCGIGDDPYLPGCMICTNEADCVGLCECQWYDYSEAFVVNAIEKTAFFNVTNLTIAMDDDIALFLYNPFIPYWNFSGSVLTDIYQSYTTEAHIGDITLADSYISSNNPSGLSMGGQYGGFFQYNGQNQVEFTSTGVKSEQWNWWWEYNNIIGMLWNASSERLGIGKAFPTATLDVNGTTTLTNLSVLDYQNAVTRGINWYPTDASNNYAEIGGAVRIGQYDGTTNIDAIDGANDYLNLRSVGSGGIWLNYNGGTAGLRLYDGGTANYIQIDPGSIIDSSGTISFGNEHLQTTGNLTDGTNSLTIANAKTAYTHSQITTGNPHSLTLTDLSSYAHTDLQNILGNGEYHISTTERSHYDTAYTHSQDNSQAHSDYLINNGNDITTGYLRAKAFPSPWIEYTEGGATNEIDADAGSRYYWNGSGDAVFLNIAGGQPGQILIFQNLYSDSFIIFNDFKGSGGSYNFKIDYDVDSQAELLPFQTIQFVKGADGYWYEIGNTRFLQI